MGAMFMWSDGIDYIGLNGFQSPFFTLMGLYFNIVPDCEHLRAQAAHNQQQASCPRVKKAIRYASLHRGQIRVFMEMHPKNNSLKEAYNLCVSAILMFRAMHRTRGLSYFPAYAEDEAQTLSGMAMESTSGLSRNDFTVDMDKMIKA